MSIDARPTISVPDDDPHLWLEDIHGARALGWVEAQNAATLNRFGSARFAADRDLLAAILARPDNIPYIGRRGSLVFNFWRDASNPRGLWRRATLESFCRDLPEWDVLLDLDRLAAQEHEDWIWQGALTLPPEHELAIIRLSRGGSDAVVLREFDLRAKRFVANGFVLPEAKGGAVWLDRDTWLISSALGEGMATRSGYARTARVWRRGQDISEAHIVCEVPYESMALWCDLDRTQNTEAVHFIERLSFFEMEVRIGDRTGPKQRLDLPRDIEYAVYGDWLAVQLRTPWLLDGTTYAQDTLLGTRLRSLIEGRKEFQVLFSPAERRSLQSFRWAGQKLLLGILDELTPVFEMADPNRGWASTKIEGLPEIGVASVWPLDIEENESKGDLLGNVENPLTPPALMLLEPGKAWQILKRAPQVFTPEGLVVSRYEAISVDGTPIPYTQAGPKEQTGNAPVHLSGYGGFRLSRLPYYRPAIGKLWLERGGTSVVANIRGGGEFGTAWHDADRRQGKRLSHDDFAAVAADLVARGVTTPKRIAAEGGSNGGILITNMLTRYPERFGALFCTIPLIDMRRYTKLLAGASWIDEYGDPDDPKDWEFLQNYSAYHQAKPQQSYPPILFATSRKDDRVHPGHARKMAAKLQAMGYEAYFYEPATGGHGFGKDHKEQAAFIALGLTFLSEKIGFSSQRDAEG
ncbi:MAG TPA: prolyl oligopeptidase family serine peptidase [Hyphomicrobiales bacterium]|nr:prolyl oligopeptidase family serine peptidase [Hyphomicrobiales bacterium]